MCPLCTLYWSQGSEGLNRASPSGVQPVTTDAARTHWARVQPVSVGHAVPTPGEGEAQRPDVGGQFSSFPQLPFNGLFL